MPETDVTKMKVADLKRELKLRGLSISGNKNELQDRLQTALLDGDLSLDDTAISDVLEEDVVGLTDDDEDKLLVDENELLKSPVTTPTTELTSSDLNVAAKPNLISPAPTKKIILKRENSQLAIASASSVSATTSKENDTPKETSSLNGLVRKHTPIVIGNSSSSGSGGGDSGEKKVTQLSAKERLELRAKRFGVQVNETPAATTGKLPSKNSNASILANNGNKETDEKQMEALKRRAERFGCVTSSKLAKQDATEKLLKRKERFGLDDGNTATTITTTTTTHTTSVASTTKVATGTTISSSGTTDIWAEKARARLERFKESSTTTTTATVPSGGTATTTNADN